MRLRSRWWWLAVPGVLVAAALVIIAVLAGTYQPLAFGSTGNSAERYPGLPTGVGIHPVNNFGGVSEDIYIPPQRGTFSLFVDIYNGGTYAVTIQSVRVPQPLTPAGPVRYSRPPGGNGALIPPLTSRVLRDVQVGPGQEIYVGIPVRTWPCKQIHSRALALPSFYATERFAMFTHTVALPWGLQGDRLILYPPVGRPGGSGISCVRN
jgi:hypothetical protein